MRYPDDEKCFCWSFSYASYDAGDWRFIFSVYGSKYQVLGSSIQVIATTDCCILRDNELLQFPKMLDELNFMSAISDKILTTASSRFRIHIFQIQNRSKKTVLAPISLPIELLQQLEKWMIAIKIIDILFMKIDLDLHCSLSVPGYPMHVVAENIQSLCKPYWIAIAAIRRSFRRFLRDNVPGDTFSIRYWFHKRLYHPTKKASTNPLICLTRDDCFSRSIHSWIVCCNQQMSDVQLLEEILLS